MGSRALFFSISVLVLIGCKSVEKSFEYQTTKDSVATSFVVKDSVCLRESLIVVGDTIRYYRTIVNTTNNRIDSIIIAERSEANQEQKPASVQGKSIPSFVVFFAVLFCFLYIIKKLLINK